VRAALGDPARVTCRLTHVYPDGPGPYFTVLAPARRGEEVAQWREMKAAASPAILDAGGTITHHHGVGRDHRPWYDGQRPDAFAAALRAAKQALDPDGVLNPGVLIDPQPPAARRRRGRRTAPRSPAKAARAGTRAGRPSCPRAW
jgi:alkyldihydroxyacetonephosphate synthase